MAHVVMAHYKILFLQTVQHEPDVKMIVSFLVTPFEKYASWVFLYVVKTMYIERKNLNVAKWFSSYETSQSFRSLIKDVFMLCEYRYVC